MKNSELFITIELSNNKVKEIIIVKNNNFKFGFKLNLSSNEPKKKINKEAKKKIINSFLKKK